MSLIALAGFALLITFLIAVVLRRRHVATALLVGTVLAALVSVERLTFDDARLWLALLVTWAVCVIGGFVGAWLARLVHAWWRRA